MSHGGGSAKLTWATIDKGVEKGSLDQMEQYQMRLRRRMRKERDATASGTPGVKRIVTDVLAELGYGKDAVIQKKVVTAIQGKGKDPVIEEVVHEEWEKEEPVRAIKGMEEEAAKVEEEAAEEDVAGMAVAEEDNGITKATRVRKIKGAREAGGPVFTGEPLYANIVTNKAILLYGSAILGGVSAEAHRRIAMRQAPPATFRLWQEKDDPPIRVEEVESDEEVTQRLRAGAIKEEPIVVELDEEGEDGKVEATSILMRKMEYLWEKIGRYQQKLVDICEKVKGWRAGIPKVFLYESDPKSMPGRPRVAIVGSGPRSGMMVRPPTTQGRMEQPTRTRGQAKASASQEPPRREPESDKRKEVVEVEDEEEEDEKDERLRQEEDQRAKQRAKKKGAHEEAEPVLRDASPRKKKYAVRLEEGFDVEKIIDRLLEGHNDLVTLKEILASAPKLRNELKRRLSRRLVPNVHLSVILPKEAEWVETGTKMDWKCVACGMVDLVVKGSKCATMVDTRAEMNIIREVDALRFELEIDRSDCGILHGANCKAVFCGTASNILIEVGGVKGPQRRYKTIDKKCLPTPVLVTEDEEVYYEWEQGLTRRMREQAAAGPCRINEGNGEKLIVGESDFLLPQERALMVELMKKRHRAYAFDDDQRGRLDVDRILMIWIHTVSHEPWNLRGARYPNPGEEKKVVDYLDDKIRTHKAEFVLKPFEEEDPWGGKDVQWMMKLALAGTHSLVEEVRTIEEGSDHAEKHEELMGGMYLLVNTLLQGNFDQISSPNPTENEDVVPESQDDEFEEGEIKEAFCAEEYDGIYLELGPLLLWEPLHPRLEREVGVVVHLDLLFMPIGDHDYNYIFDALDNLSGFVDGRAIRRKTGSVLASCIEKYYLRYPFVREFVIDRGRSLPAKKSDFAKAAMPRGGRGTRPSQRPLGASGGYERHRSRHREHTPVYDDGDIELFLDDSREHAEHMGWTVTQMIKRLRGAGRFEEPIAQIRREARTWPEVETRMQELRPSPVGPDGRPIHLEIGNMEDFIPAFEQFMHDQLVLRDEWARTLPLWTRKAERPLARQIRDMARDWASCRAHLREAFRRPEPPQPRVERGRTSKRQRDPEPREVMPSRGGRKALARREEEPVLVEEERGAYRECGIAPVVFERFIGAELSGSPQRTREEVPLSGGSLQDLEAHLDISQWRVPQADEGCDEPVGDAPREEVRQREKVVEPGDQGGRIAEGVVEVGGYTPPQAHVVELGPEIVPEIAHEEREEPRQEESLSSPPEATLSPGVRMEMEREQTDWRREAISTIDRYLAAHAQEHPHIEEPVPMEPP
ncbi:hypothetical protein CBR_g4692 [Chara braunii]|uniref:Peptidase A2 domain-containing protein n=1 Tax=Chara braunii TaxID=69332 RepID=A0A388KII7_CHABU|nr:hypothetical protein CBR_g4692 [Chara braunii]|eukprot:GBG69865.1 hypothetical protein CBR_g4692 [Chara braunii]